MKAGYTLVNAAGVDLTKTGATTQTVAGIYAKLTKALESGKRIILCNMVMGTGKTIAPTTATIYKGSSTTVIVNINWLSLSVASTNVITTTDYKYVPEST